MKLLLMVLVSENAEFAGVLKLFYVLTLSI
jgi:hypothetical protein